MKLGRVVLFVPLSMFVLPGSASTVSIEIVAGSRKARDRDRLTLS